MPSPDRSPDEPRISIIIATYEEAKTIGGTVRAILSNIAEPLEIIIVDDSPTPETARVVEQLGEARVRLIRRQGERGLASATVHGVAQARGEIIGWLDADAWMIPARLPAMIEALAAHDLVIASRYVAGGGDERDLVRVTASRLVNWFARLVLDGSIRDYSSNFILLRRPLLDHIHLLPVGFGEFCIDLVYRARRAGFSVVELPYVLAVHHAGCSKAFPDWITFLGLGAQYVFRIIAIRLRAGRPGSGRPNGSARHPP